MSIRRKTGLIISVAAVILIAGIIMIVNSVLLRSIISEEKQAVISNIERAELTIKDAREYLTAKTGDWTSSDDTYVFMFNHNAKYIESNLQIDTLTILNLDFMLFYDKNGGLYHSLVSGDQGEEQDSPPPGLERYIGSEIDKLNLHSIGEGRSGFMYLDDGIAFVCVRPILKSDLSGNAKGFGLFGYFINEEFINRIEQYTAADVRLTPVGDAENAEVQGHLAEIDDAFGRFTDEVTVFNVIPLDKDNIQGTAVIADITGIAALVMRLQMPRTQYNQGIDSLTIFIVLLSVFILAVVIIIRYTIQRTVISKIEQLSSFFSGISKNRDIAGARLKLVGNDEFAKLADIANGLFEELDSVHNELVKSQERLKLSMEGTKDGYWDWNIQRNELFLSRQWYEILGYNPDDFECKTEEWERRIHRDDFPFVSKQMEMCIRGDAPYLRSEYRMLDKDGNYKWLVNRARIVKYSDDGKPEVIAGAISDITVRKETERQVSMLSFSDKLTGLYNRAAMEKELDKAKRSGILPISVVMGDMNNLKIANDIFGHDEGDRLLAVTAKILQKCCRSIDFVARWGGDEFVMLLYKADEGTCEKVCGRIRHACAGSGVRPVSPNIALGYATMYSSEADMQEMLKDAEKMMYNDKLTERKNTRGVIISTLMDTLDEKLYETKVHTMHIRELCNKLGRKLGLTDDKLDQLSLLSVLHDIGKVAIPDSIMKKKGDLSDEEYAVMKSHAEMGNRITESIPELSQISYAILAHHENFDGTGYPNGLKGEEIPLISRIFSVVETYEKMTRSDTQSDPLDEIEKRSGKQFDPVLADAFIGMMRGNV